MSLADIEITECFDLAIQQTNSEHSRELRMKTLQKFVTASIYIFFKCFHRLAPCVIGDTKNVYILHGEFHSDLSLFYDMN